MLKILSAIAVFSAVAFSSINPALADTPGAHPAFLHALTDLRHARAHVEAKGGSIKLMKSDIKVIEEIDHCISEIKKAAIDDGKNLDDHPPVDVNAQRAGELHEARALLEGAKHDIEQKETDEFAHGLRKRAIHHLDEALKHIDKSIAGK